MKNIYNTLFEKYPSGILIIEKISGLILDCNDKSEKYFGLNKKKLSGLKLNQLLFDYNEKPIQHNFNKVELQKISHFKIKLYGKNFVHVKVRFEETVDENKEVLLLFIELENQSIKDDNLVYRLASIVEYSEDAIISKDLNGKVISWNKAAEKVYGYSAEEMIGNSILKIFPDDKKTELNTILNRVNKGENIENYETQRIRKDGVLLDISVTMSPVKDSYNKIIGASAIERDITPKKFYEEERIIREKQLVEAQQIAHLGYWEIDIKTNNVHWSDELYDIYNLKSKDYIPTLENYISRIHPDDRKTIKEIFKNALYNHRPFELNHRIILPNGEVRIISGKGEVILDESNNPTTLRGIQQDITEQKRAEKRLAAQFEITKILAKQGKLIDLTPKILQAICKGMDWQIGELWLVDTDSELLELEGSWSSPSLNSDEFIEVSRKCKFGKGVSLQGKIWESGKPVWSSHMLEDQFFPRAALAAKLNLHTALAFPVLNQDKIAGVLAFYKVDISEPDSEQLKMLESLGQQIGEFIEKKKSEPALKESEELYQTLVETSPDAIIYTDLSGKILFCNQKAAELFGFRLFEDIVEQNLYAFIAPEAQSKAVENEHNTIVNGHTKNVEYTLIKKDGTRFPAEVNSSIVLNAENVPKAFIGVIRDITERKLSDEEINVRIKQQAAITELGQFALKGTSIQYLLNKSVDLIIDTLDVEFCNILELREDINKFFIRASKGWETGIPDNYFIDTGVNTYAGYTLIFKKPVIVKNFLKENRFILSELHKSNNVVSGISVLIQGSSNPYGVLEVYSNKIKDFDPNHSHFLQAISNIIVTAIERKQVETKLEVSLKNIKEAKEQLEFSKKQLEFLTEASRILNSSLDYYETLNSIAKLITPHLADLCFVDIFTEEKKLKRVAVSNVDPTKDRLLLELEHNYPTDYNSDFGTYKVIKTGEPRLLHYIDDNMLRNISKDERHYNIFKDLELYSSIIVPLRVRGQTIGTMSLLSSHKNRLYDSNDLIFAQDLASRASGAIDNSRLFEETKMLNEKLEFKVKERTSELEISNTELEVEVRMRQNISEELKTRVLQQSAVAELGQKALTVFNLEDLIKETVKIVSKTLHIEYCGIFELSSERKELILKAGYGWKIVPQENICLELKENSMINNLLSSNDVVLLEDLLNSEKIEVPELFNKYNIIGGLSVLLKEQEKIFGVLVAFSSTKKNFTFNDSYFIRAVANILTASLDRKHAEEMSLGVLEAVPDAVLIVDEEGKIVQINTQTERMFGYKRNELIAQKVEILISESFRTQHNKDRNGYFKNPKARDIYSGLKFSGVKKDGSEFNFELSLSPFKIHEKILVAAVLREITEGKGQKKS